jgi:CHAT domain-containing protein
LELEKISNQLRQTLLIRASNRYFNGLKRLYTSIIQPLEADLTYHGVKNLIFVLDGGLRNIPMAALYDGQQFLVQKYSVSLAPSLQLIDPRPLQDQKLRVLVAALSESRQGFSPLPYVNTEVEEIQSNLPSQVLLNQKFTEASFKEALGEQSAPIIHIATHGQFSSQNETTFILTWDERLDITSLNSVLQVADVNQANPIELLVLSACETAIGDERAALGIAGMAVRSGARSTIATLWQVDDEATALFMNRFYKVLTTSKTTKTEALRQAQIEVLQDTRFQAHPYFWAPYVLVGNWL